MCQVEDVSAVRSFKSLKRTAFCMHKKVTAEYLVLCVCVCRGGVEWTIVPKIFEDSLNYQFTLVRFITARITRTNVYVHLT